jgi:exopolyphosphatase / guanosine-5'-triphosphate,3'-diphosphate pyrophosphatase
MRAKLVVHVGAEHIDVEHTAVGDTEPTARTVIPVGPESLTRLELHGDPPLPEELTNAIGYVHDLFDDAIRELLPEDPTGTLLEWAELEAFGPLIETIAAVEIGLTNPDRSAIDAFVLTRAAAEDVFRTLATERRRDRVHNPGLDPDHVDSVVGACCIVVAVMRRLRSENLVVRTPGSPVDTSGVDR